MFGRLTQKMRSFATLAALLLTIPRGACAQDSRVESTAARGIRPAVEQIYAVRGGVVTIPLRAAIPGRDWPAWLTITLADGSSVDAQVAWVAPRPIIEARHIRRWSDEAQQMTVRAIAPSDSTAVGNGTPTAIAPLPLDAAGDLTVAGESVRTVWFDPPTPFAPGVTLPDMPAGTAADTPSAESPFAYWRWLLMAERIGARPPEITNFTGLEQHLAQSIADLWMVGMRALERADESLASELRLMLTRTCSGRRGPIAAWITRRTALNELLTVLLDQRRSPIQRTLDVQSWLESQPPILIWPVRLYGKTVSIAALNRATTPVDLQLAWARDAGEPEQVRLRAGEVREFEVARPVELQDQVLGESIAQKPLILDVRFDTRRSSIQFPPQAIAASPPGVELRGLHLPLTLADVEVAQQPVIEESHATFVHVRKRSGRWEVFVDCRRPTETRSVEDQQLPLALRNPEDLIGHEAITLLIGRSESLPDRPGIMLVIPERGWWKLPLGENDGTLQIHRRSYDDRWLCRIVVPNAWATRVADESRLNAGPTTQLRLAISRTHADSRSIETGPGRIASWFIDPARMHVDLSAWEQ